MNYKEKKTPHAFDPPLACFGTGMWSGK